MMTTRKLTQTGRVIHAIGAEQALTAKAGVLSDAPQPEGSEWTMATLAAHLHYGPVGAKRKSWPWMRMAFDENIGHYRLLQKAGIGRILKGRDTPRGVLMTIAIRMKGDHQRMLTTLREPPLESSTIAAKGSSNPLIDTGALRASHAWRVE